MTSDVEEMISFGRILNPTRQEGVEDPFPNGHAAYISSDRVARDEAIIEMDGWEFDNYRLNPIVMFNHGGGGWFSPETDPLPIARSTIPEVRDDLLYAEAEFDMVDPEAARILGKVKRGLINATSVRWNPFEWDIEERSVRHDEEEKKKRYLVFKRQELLEWSDVNIPADPAAVILRSSGRELNIARFAGFEREETNEVTDELERISHTIHISGDIHASTEEIQEIVNRALASRNTTVDDALMEFNAILGRFIKKEPESLSDQIRRILAPIGE